MKKLKLDAESLTVDTFEPGEAYAPSRGTVAAHGNVETQKIICSIPTLKTDLTCCPCTPMF
jgi:hypothetical protein